MDTSTRPGADFYAYAGGRWVKSNPIPRGSSAPGGRSRCSATSPTPASARLSTSRLPRRAARDARAEGRRLLCCLPRHGGDRLERVRAGPTAARRYSRGQDPPRRRPGHGSPDLPCKTPIDVEVMLDPKAPDWYVLTVVQSGLGLPERAYYLKADKEFQDIRTKYEAHVGKVRDYRRGDGRREGEGDPRAGDEDCRGALARRRAAGSRQDVQPADGRGAREGGADVSVEGLPGGAGLRGGVEGDRPGEHGHAEARGDSPRRRPSRRGGRTSPITSWSRRRPCCPRRSTRRCSRSTGARWRARPSSGPGGSRGTSQLFFPGMGGCRRAAS